MGLAFDTQAKRVSKESSEAVAGAALQAAVVSRELQARLGFLYDGTEVSMAVPDMELFRSGIAAAQHRSEVPRAGMYICLVDIDLDGRR